jgi:hypothetical protein
MKKIIIMVSLTLALIGLILSTSCTPSKTSTIATNSLPEGTEGQAYSQTLQVHGGIPPYTWFAMATLPPGLRLDPLSGVISGTPLAGWGASYNLPHNYRTNSIIAAPDGSCGPVHQVDIKAGISIFEELAFVRI